MDDFENNPEAGIEQSPEDKLFAMMDPGNGTPEKGDELEDHDEEEVVDGEEDQEGDNEPDTDDDGEEDEESEDDSEEEALDPDAEYIEFEVDGKPVKVTSEEYAQGYLRQADFTRKTQDLANQRAELHKISSETTQARLDYIEALEVFKSESEGSLAKFEKVDWKDLKEYDIDKYNELRAEQSEIKDRIELAKADQQKAMEEQEAANIKAFTDAKAISDEILSSEEGIPGWTDEKVGPKVKAQMREFALSVGYTDEDLTMLIDPRALKVLHMAMTNKVQEKASVTVKEKRKAKVPKVVRSGARNTAQKSDQRSKLADRLKQTRSSEAAEDVLFDMMQGGKR